MIYIKNRKKCTYLILFLAMLGALPAAALFDTSKKIFAPGRNEREEQLTHIKTELTAWQTANQEQSKKVQSQIDQTDRMLADAKSKLASLTGVEADFVAKKASLLNEGHQVLSNSQLLRKEITADLSAHVKLLEEYKKDPAFKEFELQPQAVYSFDLIQSLNKKVLFQDDALAQLTAQKNDALAELDSRKKKLTLASKEYLEKKRAQEDFGTKIVALFPEFDFQQRGELLDLTEKLASYEKQVAELKVQEMVRRISLINTKIFIESEKLKVLKDNLNKVKGTLRVSDAQVQSAREKLEKSKSDSLATKDKLYQEIKQLTAERERMKKELELLTKRYANTDRNVTAWSVATKTPENYSALAELGYKNSQIALLDRKIEYLHTQIDLADAQFKRQEVTFLILSMWQKLAERRMRAGDDVVLLVKRFKDMQAEAQRELAVVMDKRNAATNLLNLQNKEAGNLKNLLQEIQSEQEVIFKRYPTRYAVIAARLADAEKTIAEQIESTSKIIEVDSNLIATLDETTKELNFVLNELEAKSIWQRSEYAISWYGIKNVIPDFGVFLKDFMHLIGVTLSKLSIKNLWEGIKNVVTRPLLILFLIAFGLFLFFAYFFLRRTLQMLRSRLLTVMPIARIVMIGARILGVILLCIERHYTSLFVWFVLLGLFSFDILSDLFLRACFYLGSIPFFIYIATQSLRLILGTNRTQNYPLFSKHFEQRFTTIFYLFSYVSIGVLLFREAFIAVTMHKSELPTILLASYSLFLRIMIIFSIGKDEVVSFIARQGSFGNWISKYINTYYYVLLAGIIAIMVVSDPYVGGFGNLISYLIWGTIGTIVLIQLLILANMYIRRFLATAFFAPDEEAMHERFAYAKSLYGVAVIVLFLAAALGAFFLTLRIWLIPVSWADVSNVLNFQLFDTGVDKTTGQLVWFTPLKLLVVLGFIAGGFLIAVLVNRFVLRFIFELIPVDLGIQNTISSILRYLIIVIAIYLGFQWGGLGTLLIPIGVVIGSIGYIVKEPIGDFISYFIILVQRPIQVGDYIMLDAEHEGIVRKITPRSIILRRRDSYTIIVPNSMILNRPINNWNYARNFVGFDDIDFTVSFDADPLVVRKLIFQVLESNTDILKSPRPVVRLNDFNENGYLFKVRGFVSEVNVNRKWDIASDIRFALTKILREHGIKIAVPTRILITKESIAEEQQTVQ